jgi:hypothetical protein
MENLEPYKSKKYTKALNKIRVWPKGPYRWWKKLRWIVKRFVLSSFFENLMTISVTINTVGLAVDHYGMDKEFENIFNKINLFFTILFTCEMAIKLFGLGIVGYLSETMNYLDGGVVILSLVEVIFL